MEKTEFEAKNNGIKKQKLASGGIFMFALSIIVSTGLCSLWLRQHDDLLESPLPSTPGISTVALVEPQELEGAVSTLTEAVRGVYQDRNRTCSRPLAWVALAADSQGKAATIRLRSGNYYSPVIRAAPEAKRVAVPLPAPYETGRGQLLVMHEGGPAQVGLQPVLHIPENNAMQSLQVTWPVDPRCVKPNG